MTKVRFADMSDIPSLVELGRQMHLHSRYAWMMFNATRLWTYLEHSITDKSFCVIVAAQNPDLATDTGRLEGVLVARVHGYPFSNDLLAQVDYLYVHPAARGSSAAMKMLSGFKRWAKNREVAEVIVPNRFGANEAYVTKFLTKLGMPAVGGLHAMWLPR